MLDKLDYETKNQYIFALTAKISTKKMEYSTFAMVVVNVLNVNDHPPRIVESPSVVNVSENQEVGTQVFTVKATDIDGDSLSFSLTNAGGLYRITSDGAVILAGQLDYFRVQNSFSIVITVSDGVYSVNTTVKVNVLKDERPPPQFTKAVYTVTVTEKMNVSDEFLTLRLTNDYPPSVFEINDIVADTMFNISAGGVMSLAKKVNYKLQEQYVFTVTVKDQRSTGLTAVVVNVLAGMCPTIHPLTKHVTIDQKTAPGTHISSFVGSDVDSVNLTWSLPLGYSWFKVDQKGNVSTFEKFHNAVGDYDIDVSVSDGSCTAKAVLTVRIENWSFCPDCGLYKFPSPYYEVEMDEGVAPALPILTVSIGTTDKVTYYINDTLASEPVTINSTTGKKLFNLYLP